MSREMVPPTITRLDADNTHYDEIETHPAYAQIGASRVNGSAVLYGSDFKHNGYISIRVHRSTLHRGLSNDWRHEDLNGQYIEVALSEAQWATFVSTLNMGSGTPCTLTACNNKTVPGIPDPPDRHAQFKREADARIANGMEALKTLRRAVDALPGTSAKAKKALLDQVATTERELGANLGYVADQFTEHMETVTEHAKIEVNAYLTAAVHRAGLQALTGKPTLELHGGKEE